MWRSTDEIASWSEKTYSEHRLVCTKSSWLMSKRAVNHLAGGTKGYGSELGTATIVFIFYWIRVIVPLNCTFSVLAITATLSFRTPEGSPHWIVKHIASVNNRINWRKHEMLCFQWYHWWRNKCHRDITGDAWEDQVIDIHDFDCRRYAKNCLSLLASEKANLNPKPIRN